MADNATNDEFLRDLAAAARAHLEFIVRVSDRRDERTIYLEEPFASPSLDGTPVGVFDVPASDRPGSGWNATGKFVDASSIEFQSPTVMRLRDESLRMSRTSRRIDKPDCEVVLKLSGSPDPIPSTCLDLSAGGAGVQTSQRVSLSVGDTVTVEVRRGAGHHALTGNVAYVAAGRSGSKLGIQFFALEQSAATAYYGMLNDIAGEVVADLGPPPHAMENFFDALSSGDATLTVDTEGMVIGTAFECASATSAQQLLRGARRLSVKSGELIWTADVRWARGLELAVLQIGQTSEAPPDVRTSGYRVAAPRGARVQIERDSSDAITAEVLDLSRGGVGFKLPPGVELRWMEHIDLRLSLASTGLVEQVRGRVAYVKREPSDGGMRVGVAFLGLPATTRDAIHDTLNRLEDREVVRRVVVFGAAVFVFLLGLICFGTLVAPERGPSQDLPDEPAKLSHEITQ